MHPGFWDRVFDRVWFGFLYRGGLAMVIGGGGDPGDPGGVQAVELPDFNTNRRQPSSTLYKVTDKAGKVVGLTRVVVRHEDVTEQYQAEIDILEAEADERKFVEDMTKEEVLESFGPSGVSKTAEQISLDTARLTTLKGYFE